MEEFYRELDKILKPKPLGKALKDKKQRTAQSAYQKEQLGDAFIDDKELLSKAKQSAFQLAEDNADKDMMYEAFYKETNIDLKKLFDTDKVGNPISDIADSYFIQKVGYENSNSNKS